MVEGLRRARQFALNLAPATREELPARYGDVWEVYLVVRFLADAGAVVRVRKLYRPQPGFRLAAVLAWLGADADDLAEGRE